jgi:iron(III) transport system substrate-binding protein
MMHRSLATLALAALLGLAAAQQPVTFYTAGPGGLANALAEAFTAATGIPVEVYQATSGDVLARLEAERGNPRADVVVLASWGEGQDLVSRGFVAPYESPERAALRDGWYTGALAAQGGAALAVIVNTLEVADDERPTSWFDLLGPEWEDAITMPDPTLSGSAAEFLAIFVQNVGDEAWTLFADLANNGLLVPGPNNAALNPVLTGERRATIAGVDYITYGNIARGEALAIVYPEEGTAVALRPVFLQDGAPNAEGGQAFIDFMLSAEGQALVASVYLIPSREGVEALRPVPGDFVALPADDAEVAATVGAIVERFRSEIVEGIVQRR